MDSIQKMTHQRVLRGSSEYDRLQRINAAPYDTPNIHTPFISTAVPKRFICYIKDKMADAVSSLKHLFQDTKTSSLASIPLTHSLQLPAFSQEKLNNLSASIQDTVSKPEFHNQYRTGSDRYSDSKKSSVMNVVDFYKDVSTEKVRESMKKENSNVIPQAVGCQRRPVPLYTDKNTVIEGSRRKQGYSKNHRVSNLYKYSQDHLNEFGKRGLRSILYQKDKANRGNKKVSFVPQLQRVSSEYDDFLIYPKSSSSIIKYNSSDDEDPMYMQDHTQKKIFIDDKVILKKEPTIQLSLIKAKKLKPNTFYQKKLIEKASKIESCLDEKVYKKEYSREFGKKYRGFGNDNLLNDSKVETDSDDSGLLHHSLDSQSFQVLKALGAKKNQRDRMESSSDLTEKEDPALSVSPSQKIESPKTPVVDEEENFFEQEILPETKPQDVEKELQINIESSKKQEESKTSVEPAKSSIFQNILQPKEVKEFATETPKQKGNLISLIMQEPKEERKQIVQETSQVKPLFGSLSSYSQNIPQEKSKEEKETKLPASTIPEEPKAASKLFSNDSSSSIFAQKTDQVSNPFLPINKKEENIPVAPVLAKDTSKVNEEALKNPIFASIVNNSSQPAQNDNPFLNFSSQPQKPVSFTELISGGSKSTEKTNIEQTIKSVENSSSVIGNLNDEKPKGILELFQSTSQGPKQESKLLTRTLTPTSGALAWLSGGSTSQQPSLFSNLSGTSNTQATPLFTQAPQQPSAFGQLFSSANNNESSIGMFGNNNSMMGETGNSLFGSSNNNASNTLFSGNVGNPIMGGSSNQSGGMGMFGGMNTSSDNGGNLFQSSLGTNDSIMGSNNPFLSQGSFGGNSSGGFGSSNMSSNSYSMGSGQKKKNQKERAF